MTSGLVDKIIWLIEDDDHDADLVKQHLEDVGFANIFFVRVRPAVTDYSDIIGHPETGVIIVDQRFKTQGVPYKGVDLANYFREINNKVPIYILTAYKKDYNLERIGQSVEGVIEKNDMYEATEVYLQRFLRSMSRYDEAVGVRQARLKELIDRQVAGDITQAELAELQLIRNEIEKPFAADADKQDALLTERLERQQQELSQVEGALERILQRLDNKGSENGDN